MHSPPQILVVDDSADTRDIMLARLSAAGYAVRLAADGDGALQQISAETPDLVLLDVMMPGIDGIETARRIKANSALDFFPVILLTARTDNSDVVFGLEAGADDYLTKPIQHSALLARVRAMLRVKLLQDQLRENTAALAAKAAELAALNAALEQRVATQLAAVERAGRLRRFLPPQVAQTILNAPDVELALASHRRDIAVLFCDLRGFTAFAETAEAEDVLALLGDYHRLVGELAFRHSGTLERFVGDAIMVFFNDPVPMAGYCDSAAHLATDILAGAEPIVARWRRNGAAIGIGIGITAGFATLGTVGFRGRVDYAAIGSVTNLASRLSTMAAGGQILVNARFAAAVGPSFATRALGEFDLHGLARPVPVHELGLPLQGCK